MFDRLVSLIGEDNLDLISSKNILLLGVGGVGGYVAEGLIRSGILNLTVVDDDVIDVSNLNRQLIALNSTIGMKKVDVIKARLLDINSGANIKSIGERVKAEDISKWDLERFDYVIDCIDDVDVKVALAKYALQNDIKLIMSMGTAKKLHPELLKMTTLNKTCYDALAKKVRMLLRGEDIKKLVVLSSTEEPIKSIDKSLSSCIFVPAVGGLLIANYVINDIIGL